MKIVLFVLIYFIGLISGIILNHGYLVFRMRKYRKYTLYIAVKKNNISRDGYTCIKSSALIKCLINICSECNIPVENMEIVTDSWNDENVYLKLFCTEEELKKFKFKICEYSDRFYIKESRKGWKI